MLPYIIGYFLWPIFASRLLWIVLAVAAVLGAIFYNPETVIGGEYDFMHKDFKVTYNMGDPTRPVNHITVRFGGNRSAVKYLQNLTITCVQYSASGEQRVVGLGPTQMPIYNQIHDVYFDLKPLLEIDVANFTRSECKFLYNRYDMMGSEMYFAKDIITQVNDETDPFLTLSPVITDTPRPGKEYMLDTTYSITNPSKYPVQVYYVCRQIGDNQTDKSKPVTIMDGETQSGKFDVENILKKYDICHLERL